MDNLLKHKIEQTDVNSMSSHEIADFLHQSIHTYGKLSKIPVDQRHNHQGECSSRHGKLEDHFERQENQKWEYIRNCGDVKCLWSAINLKGEVKPSYDEGNVLDVDELAEVCCARSRIDVSQTILSDLNTDVTNPELDKEIDESEIEAAVNHAKDSKTSDGIAASTVKKILPTIMSLLILLYNLMLKGGVAAYPSRWLSFVNALPKKGKLMLPKMVRFITVMGIFEKIYQIILSNRLVKFLKIPFPQTAYQKERGCNIHVMTIRLMKILAKKSGEKLFIIFTDFEAAFDLVSRRLLFQKLIRLGVSAVFLNALIAIYISGKSVVEHDNQFSDYLLLLAGVKQGAPPSGLLYIAYTMGLIDMYDNSFHPEPLIFIYHMLVHADDILMLATSRTLAIQKMVALLKYCANNYIRLQITKCSFMCVNTNDTGDEEPLQLQNLLLNPTCSEVYLGSVITNSPKIADDVNADIKHRQLSIVKYYAFLRSNRNAPLDVKMKTLDACLSSLVYNGETWASANFDHLEVIYRRMLKSSGGVGMTVCNEFVYLELGIVSLRTQVMIKQYRFWKSVMEMCEGNPIVYVIKEARRQKVKEVRYYDKLINDHSNVDEIIAKFYDKIRNDIRNKAANGRSKYITYLQINPHLNTPTFYKDTHQFQHMSMIAKLRTSSHNLLVEMGRRTGTARERRICICGNNVEDEKHFIVDCNIYDDIRRKHGIRNKTLADILNDAKNIQYLLDIYQRRKELLP